MTRLLDMRPGLPLDDGADRSAINSVAGREINLPSTGCALCANAPYSVSRESGQSVSLPSRCSALSLLVGLVVVVRAEEEVSGVLAASVVAGVEDLEPLGDRAVGELPSEPMGEVRPTVRPEPPVEHRRKQRTRPGVTCVRAARAVYLCLVPLAHRLPRRKLAAPPAPDVVAVAPPVRVGRLLASLVRADRRRHDMNLTGAPRRG